MHFSTYSPIYLPNSRQLTSIHVLILTTCRPTFYRVYKKKSTEGFQSLPYVVALFSAMLWIYYAFVKTNEYLLITINAFGCIIETIYIVMYLTYAPKKAKVCENSFLLYEFYSITRNFYENVVYENFFFLFFILVGLHCKNNLALKCGTILLDCSINPSPFQGHETPWSPRLDLCRIRCERLHCSFEHHRENPATYYHCIFWSSLVLYYHIVNKFNHTSNLQRVVIKTKSVEFMPFSLSFFLTLSAVVWFSYGLLIKDIYVAVI